MVPGSFATAVRVTLTLFELEGRVQYSVYDDCMYGRKPAMMLFLVIKLLFNVLSTVAPVYWVFALARFFVGMGATGAYLVAFVLGTLL